MCVKVIASQRWNDFWGTVYIGCPSRDEWNLRLPVLYISRLLQRRWRTCIPTLDSSPSIVVLISAHLPTGHWLFHWHAPVSDFGDRRSFAAAARRLWNTLPANLRQTTSCGQFMAYKSLLIMTLWFLVLHKYTYLLTYLLTYRTYIMCD